MSPLHLETQEGLPWSLMGNKPPAFPLWKLKNHPSGRSQCCYERGIEALAPSF